MHAINGVQQKNKLRMENVFFGMERAICVAYEYEYEYIYVYDVRELMNKFLKCGKYVKQLPCSLFKLFTTFK